jgi:hypothetical protein
MLTSGAYALAADFLTREAGRLEAEMARASRVPQDDVAPIKHGKFGD